MTLPDDPARERLLVLSRQMFKKKSHRILWIDTDASHSHVILMLQQLTVLVNYFTVNAFQTYLNPWIEYIPFEERSH